MEFYHIGKAGLKLLTSCDLPALASQNAGIQVWTTMPGQYMFFKMKTLMLMHPDTKHSSLFVARLCGVF